MVGASGRRGAYSSAQPRPTLDLERVNKESGEGKINGGHGNAGWEEKRKRGGQLRILP